MGVPAETPASYAKTVITLFYALQKHVSEKLQDTINFSVQRYEAFEPPLFEREVQKSKQIAWDPYKIVWDCEGFEYLADFDTDVGDVSPNWRYIRGSFPKKPHRKHMQVTAEALKPELPDTQFY